MCKLYNTFYQQNSTRMNHTGEDLSIYRRGKKLNGQLRNSQVLPLSRTVWGRTSGETPFAHYTFAEEAPKEQILFFFRDKLSGKRTETSDRKNGFQIGLFAYPCISRDHFNLLKWFLFFQSEEWRWRQ